MKETTHGWLQVASLFLANGAIIFAFHMEARSDWHNMDVKLDKIREDFREFREMWAMESKEFHGRLCSIEERNKGK